MLLIDLQQFVAANPAMNPKLLGQGIGVDAQDLDTSQGDFRGRRVASAAHTLVGYGATQQASIYRFGRDTASDTAYWLASAGDVDWARSMLASDPTERTYWTDGTKPKYTDSTLLGSPPYPSGYVDLGVPAPTGTMILAVGVAGTGPDETRTFTETFVRANLDESAPNTTTASITVPGGSTVLITSLSAAPGGSHGIVNRRIYASTGGDYQRAVDQIATTLTATDTGARGAILETGGSTTKPAWLTPADDLKGLLPLWNGMHGAHAGKAYSVCVSFNPHAWPVEYRRVLPDTIVGTATFGENWLIVTTGLPRLVTGTSPLGMGARPVPIRQAGVSKKSVKGVGHGACWASNDGLCYHGQYGTKILTKDLLTKAQWRALVPSTIIGAHWNGWYIGFYNDGTRKGFMIDPANPAGIIWLTQGAFGVFEDSVSETLFVLDASNAIKKWDAGTAASATFKSRVYRLPAPSNPAVARVVATTYPVTFSLWGDGALRHTRTVTSDNGFRLPGGYEVEELQVQITGAGPVEGVFVGESMDDLP